MRKWKWLFVMAVLGLLDPGGEVAMILQQFTNCTPNSTVTSQME
jgi:hypothetical protein